MFEFFKTVKNALFKTGSLFSRKISELFSKPWDEETFEKLEQLFFEADLGSSCAVELTEAIKAFLSKNREATPDEILNVARAFALDILQSSPRKEPELSSQEAPRVFLIVGVNGSGKTTSIAKLAQHFTKRGEKVLLAAGDTFRAAAIEQLSTWADRLKIEIVKGSHGADPSSIVFDALTSAKARGSSLVLIDTAGRLQNKTDLMHELEKIKKTCRKVIPDAPHKTILVLDANTGQNGLDQARIFDQFTPLNEIFLTKFDGSSKGGIILAIYKELKIPVAWLGVGESPDEMIPFEPASYVNTLFERA